MISKTITNQIAQAMKAQDKLRVSTLRLLSSALNYEKIAKQHDLSEEEELVVVRREAKKRKDAIEIFTKAGAKERAEKEERELEILQEFLPEEMSDEELDKLVDAAIKETGAEELKDVGRVMGVVMKKVDGKAEGGRVSELVKNKLSH